MDSGRPGSCVAWEPDCESVCRRERAERQRGDVAIFRRDDFPFLGVSERAANRQAGREAERREQVNIGSLLARHAQYRPYHTAIVFEDRRLTFLELNQRVNRLANALLNLGVRKGDKVATILPNCLELLESYWAVVKIGAVIVPLSQLLRGKGLLNLLRDSDTF